VAESYAGKVKVIITIVTIGVVVMGLSIVLRETGAHSLVSHVVMSSVGAAIALFPLWFGRALKEISERMDRVG